MKKLCLLLLVATFVLFTSCEKDAEPEPYSLAADLQNGYWEYSWSVLKFNGTNITDYFTGGWNMDLHVQCIRDKSESPYTLEDNTFISRGDTIPFKIEGDVLIIDYTQFGIDYPLEYQRKEVLRYPDC